jgi:hypothetical protein
MTSNRIYAAALVALIVALGVVREVVRPVERVASGVVGTLVLALVGKLTYDNWDAICNAYQVLDGKAPLFG